MKSQPLPVYIVNLKERKDRLLHIQNQFQDKDCFHIHIIEAIKHPIGALGLFESFKKCIKLAQKDNLDYVILCEDDHAFTNAFSIQRLAENITLGEEKGFDLLLGGVSGFDNAIAYKEGIFWLERFTGLQFTVVYKRFYNRFLHITLKNHDNIDLEMYKHTDRIFALYPQISFQKNFNYSDVTAKNTDINVEEYFITTENRFSKLLTVASYYHKLMEASSYQQT